MGAIHQASIIMFYSVRMLANAQGIIDISTWSTNYVKQEELKPICDAVSSPVSITLYTAACTQHNRHVATQRM